MSRNEAVLTKGRKAVEVFDHDYPHLGVGKVIPHGIYDVRLNQGYLSLGNSHETARFVVDNLEWWWENFGKFEYPQATRILILCDSGGSRWTSAPFIQEIVTGISEKNRQKVSNLSLSALLQ